MTETEQLPDRGAKRPRDSRTQDWLLLPAPIEKFTDGTDQPWRPDLTIRTAIASRASQPTVGATAAVH
ncbi:hypothetical protein ABZ468_51950 [Streptomyces sp. NPDC005708]|uniref:hypothetical protein n=1 Tax=Streptomyces sp. NPDC005708 TaxID=3154564 RepID=UPI0033C78F46